MAGVKIAARPKASPFTPAQAGALREVADRYHAFIEANEAAPLPPPALVKGKPMNLKSRLAKLESKAAQRSSARTELLAYLWPEDDGSHTRVELLVPAGTLKALDKVYSGGSTPAESARVTS
jgi:hypothetical protein